MKQSSDSQCGMQPFHAFGFCLHIWFLLWLHFVSVAFVTGCKSCRNNRVEREKRLLTVQEQILAKLGLTKPPNDEATFNVTRNVIQTYRNAVQEKDKLSLQFQMCRSQMETDEEYFAKRVERLVLEKELAKTVITSSNEITDVYSMRFSIGKLATESARVFLAELRLYQIPNKRHPQSNVRIKVCENTQESNNADYGSSLIIDSKWSVSSEERWVSLDVTSVVRGWVNDPGKNKGLTVTVTSSVKKGEDYDVSPIFLGGPVGTKLEKDEDPWPHILVWFVPRERVHSTNRQRNRRSLDWQYCQKQTRDPRCCLRSLYIDFKKDLRWKWIHAPKGYYANYCAGRCPLMWGGVKQNHHTSIMALYNKIHPDAPGDPCCVPTAYEPLVILYFKDGQPKVDELSNMAVSQCTCL